MQFLHNPRNPWFWVFFGVLGFNLLCIVSDWMITTPLFNAQLVSEWAYDHRDSDAFRWLEILNPLAGFALGIVSSLCTKNWNDRLLFQSRLLALRSGLLIGTIWAVALIQLADYRYFLANPRYILIHPCDLIFDFAYLAPPLLWSICLVIFALFARPERAGQSSEIQ